MICFVDEHCKWYETGSRVLTIKLIGLIYLLHLLIVLTGQGEVMGQGASAPSRPQHCDCTCRKQKRSERKARR